MACLCLMQLTPFDPNRSDTVDGYMTVAPLHRTLPGNGVRRFKKSLAPFLLPRECGLVERLLQSIR